MSSSKPTASSAIVASLQRDILPVLPAQLEQLTPEAVEAVRAKLQALRYCCAVNGFEPAVLDRLSAALNVSQGLWELLEQNSSTFIYLRQMEKIRGLDLGANLMGQCESAMAGETKTREFVLSCIATCLGWVSDTIWVDLARADLQAIPNAHAIQLQDALWEFLGTIRPTKAAVSVAEAQAMQEKIGLLFDTLANKDLAVGGRALLVAGLYLIVLVLNLEQTIRLLEKPGAVAP
jgi:hypothetical protein